MPLFVGWAVAFGLTFTTMVLLGLPWWGPFVTGWGSLLGVVIGGYIARRRRRGSTS